MEKTGPQMPLVSKPNSRACRAERLAGARACPNWAIVRPPSSAQGKGPDADSREEMALSEASQVVGQHVFDRSFINNTWGDVARFNKVAQPLGSVRIELVVVSGHGRKYPTKRPPESVNGVEPDGRATTRATLTNSYCSSE